MSTAPRTAGAGPSYLHVVTDLPVQRWRDVPAFMRMALRVRKQMVTTPGVVTFQLKAKLLNKRFYTYSIWTERRDMGAFVRTEPHASAVRKTEAWAGAGAAFAEWESPAAVIDWKAGFVRLLQPTFRYQKPTTMRSP